MNRIKAYILISLAILLNCGHGFPAPGVLNIKAVFFAELISFPCNDRHNFEILCRRRR